MCNDDEVARYKKKSNKSPPKKSKHKHYYENCVYGYYDLIFTKEKGMERSKYATSIGTYCPLCGKVGTIYDNDNPKWVVYSNFISHTWTEEAKKEFDKKTRTLPYFWIDSQWFVKYVDLDLEGVDIK